MCTAQIQILAGMKSASNCTLTRVLETSYNDTIQQKLCPKDGKQEGWLAASYSLHFIIIIHICRIQMDWFTILGVRNCCASSQFILQEECLSHVISISKDFKTNFLALICDSSSLAPRAKADWGQAAPLNVVPTLQGVTENRNWLTALPRQALGSRLFASH